MTPWPQLTPEQRANVCQRVWRRLEGYGATSAVGLVHALNLPLDNVGGALSEMEQRGAASRAENSAGVEIWSATKRDR